MVFRIQAALKFATSADRAAASATISSAISGRNTTVIRNNATTMKGVPVIDWEAEEQDTGDAGTIYALIQAMTTPLAGSIVNHHTCRHDEGTGFCIDTARKVW
jgi:hypothetical protein